MAINLSRNTRLWVSTVKTGHDNSNTFELPIQDGYTLTQSVTTADVTLDEAGPSPTRGSKRFNASLEPVEWAFSTYFNPYTNATDSEGNVFNFAVDMLMWHGLASGNSTALSLDDANWDEIAPGINGAEVFGDTVSFNVGFNNNSAHVLTKLYMYFEIDNDVYFVDNAQVGQAEVSVDIADIAMTSWSGSAVSYKRMASAPTFIATGGGDFDNTTPSLGYVAVPTNKVYLINKLTVLDFTSDVLVESTQKYYTVPVTAATVTINNNVTYLTPNTLAQVDTPIGSFTGSFEVTGNLDAYMRKTGGDGISAGTAYGTTELLEHMLSDTSRITSTTVATINIGGTTTGTPLVAISMPTLQLSVPSISVDDVVSTSIEFKAIPTSADLKSGTELSIAMTSSQA